MQTVGVTLRDFLDEKSAPRFGNLADLQVSEYSIHFRLTQIHRALVAHAVLCKRLASLGVQMPINSFIEAINLAFHLEVIDVHQSRWLRHFNNEANRAKHHGLPF